MQDRGVVEPIAEDELNAFETALRDLVGVALRSLETLDGAVSLPQFRLLLVLHEHGRSPSTRVAEALGLAGSSVTRLADRLAASGHLIRGAEPANRSVVTLELTASGSRLVQEATTRRRQELARLLQHLDPAIRAACAQGLRDLHTQMGDGYTAGLHSPMPL